MGKGETRNWKLRNRGKRPVKMKRKERRREKERRDENREGRDIPVLG